MVYVLQKDWTFINHGAFGAVLKEAHQSEIVEWWLLSILLYSSSFSMTL
jgi:hypothetical protein